MADTLQSKNISNNPPEESKKDQANKNGGDSEEEYVESSQLGDNKEKKGVLKRKIIQAQVDRLYGENSNQQYQSSAGEYYNVNMDLAVNYVLAKGKILKEKLENENISQMFVEEHLKYNKHFLIAYNSFLQQLINKKILHPEFKSVKPKTLEKLEQFFIERIDMALNTIKIQQEYDQKVEEIQSLFDQRINQLKQKIAIKNKIQID